MLNIYYGDALTDKEAFLFDHIDSGRKTILLVPDQFSLQAERDALRYCGHTQAHRAKAGEPDPEQPRALLELMVTDFSALGHKVVKETDGHEPKVIDRYGRHMLLSVLLEKMNQELLVFRSRRDRGAGNSALAEQLNALISEMKRSEFTPADLRQVIDHLRQEAGLSAPDQQEAGLPAPDRQEDSDHPRNTSASGKANPSTGSYLIAKLEDVLRVYRAYEESIAGVYQDAEDYITYYAGRIPASDIVRGSDVWIYGFDTFTPKNYLVIRRLLETADSVSVVLTYEDAPQRITAPVRSLTQGGGTGLFRLPDQVMQRLEDTAEEAGVPHCRRRIEYGAYPRPSIWTAGHHAGGSSAAENSGETGTGTPATDDPEPPESRQRDPLRSRIHLVQTSGCYEEAESAAAFIQSLVRDQGYRYGEIAVLCNDMDGRGRQLLRAFDRWDIPAFADQKRKVLHQPVVSFLLSFLEVLTDGFGGGGTIGMIKSGLLGWSIEDEEMLENYIREFRIRGKRWQQEFTLTGDKYTPEELERLNEMRAFLVSVCGKAKESVGRRNSGEEKVRGLARFLQEEFQIQERIRETVERQRELNLMEGAAETAQIWNAICELFEQIVQVIGSEHISNGMLRDMITAGLQTLEIGLVPASSDCVLLGTLQRSRPAQIRALVVTGANAGLLPLDMIDEGLLSRREKQRLEAMELEFAGRERIAQMEEQLAICRLFALPSEHLYVSCSQSGDDGSMLRPAEIFRILQKWQPEVVGNLNSRNSVESVGSGKAAVPYLAEVLRSIKGNEMWGYVLEWYREHDPGTADRILRGARFDNHMEALGEQMADALYRGDREALLVSASRLEKYSGCPFAHFVQYGLRADEEQVFEVGGREIGDLYHQCLMEFSRSLEEATAAAGRRTDAERPGPDGPTWQTITEEECREKVAEILRGDTPAYREGLFASDESSRFRMERITEICGDIAWTMVKQVRQGNIKSMYFEAPFGERPDSASPDQIRIPAVEVNVGDKKVLIRGKIDRMEVIDAGEGQPDAVRIVDYKTGNNDIRVDEFRSGYKLQLMVYMDAALRAKAGEGEAAEDPELQPAGVFYFKIRDFNIDGDDKGIPDADDPEDMKNRMEKFYKMEGVVINDRNLIGAMDERVDGTDKAESAVIPVKYDPKKEAYTKTKGGTLLEKEEFQEILEETNRQVERICREICRGEIEAIPRRESDKDLAGNYITACRYCGFQSICGFDPSIPGCRYEPA